MVGKGNEEDDIGVETGGVIFIHEEVGEEETEGD